MSSLASTAEEMLVCQQEEQDGQNQHHQVNGEDLALRELEDVGINEGLYIGSDGDDASYLMPPAEFQQP